MEPNFVVDMLVLVEMLVYTAVDLLVLTELLVHAIIALLLHVRFVTWFCNLCQDVHVDDRSCKFSSR